jgi:hypothetical protein
MRIALRIIICPVADDKACSFPLYDWNTVLKKELPALREYSTHLDGQNVQSTYVQKSMPA